MIAYILLCIICVLFAYWLGLFIGQVRHLDLVKRHLERATEYQIAVDDLDKWCGHTSPHAKLIARHLKAIGERTGHNSGTPIADEACSIQGLREQLEKLDYAQSSNRHASGAE